jgi:alkylation response protein AidB-like acyl-CoA dehydrogenase
VSAPASTPLPGRAADPVATAHDLADRLLRPQAERADTEGVDRAVVDRLGQAGLLGLAGPRGYGGADAPDRLVREVTEVLAGADGSTWFVTTQHALPLRTLGRSDNVALKERHLRGMCTGELLAGVAVAHLRRPGPPPVTATPTPGGWRFDGHVGWATSWGLADLLLLCGLSPDDRVVMALVPAAARPGLTAGAPMRLAAMQGTGTVALDLDGLQVAAADVAEVTRAVEWREADRVRTANATPAVFGLLTEVVARLASTGQRRADGTARELARRLGEEGEELRRAAYALVDHVPAPEQVEDRLALRAASLELVVRAATALVAATGGSAMSSDAAPQRLAREALFHLVQAQTPPVRQAVLEHLLDRTA